MNPILSDPVSPQAIDWARRFASATLFKMAAPSLASDCPAGVSEIPRAPRTKTAAPKWCSSAAMRLDSAGCAMASDSAARLIEPAPAMVTR